MSIRKRRHSEAGFSLIELMVSVTLFAVVMIICIATLLALVDANRKARALESVMNNLNITLDSMVRAMRQGTNYACGTTAIPSPATGADCVIDGNTTFSFAPFGANQSLQNQRWVYRFQGGVLQKSENGGSTYIDITSPEVVIESLRFYVVGTARRNTVQPKVVMVVKGVVGGQSRARSAFYIQATAVQRVLDI